MENTENKYPRGSEWRKWDLHIHTPGTAKNNQFGTGESVWEEYISKLESKGDIAVLGITDYFSIDNYLVLKRKQDEGRLQGKTLIPNVELRLLPVTQRDTPINLHVLFNPELSSEVIEREFFQNIKFTYNGNSYSCLRRDLISLGRAFSNNNDLDDSAAWRVGIGQFNISYYDLNNVIQRESLSKHIVVAVSNGSSDGNSGIQHSSLAATRQEIYRMSHIIFSANDNDIQYFLGKKGDDESTIKVKYGGLKPCVIGSDAHSMDYINVFPNNKCTWIKADPTFEGLRQVLEEPANRVYIGSEPPLLTNIQKNRTKYIKELIIDGIEGYSGAQGKWFEKVRIPFNPELVAIIGNKGNGKSAISDILAYCCRTNMHDYFSFLRDDKFWSKSLANNFKASVTFEDGTIIGLENLSKQVPLSDIPLVKYIPQGYFESICNDLQKEENLKAEIENVVFQYIDESMRLGASSFKELISKKSEAIDNAIQQLKIRLSNINSRIIELEDKAHPTYKKRIDDAITVKENEVNALVKPNEVQKPEQDDESTKKIVDRIASLKNENSQLEVSISALKNEQNKITLDISRIDIFIADLNRLVNEVKEYIKDKDSFIKEMGIEVDKLLSITLDLSTIKQVKALKENRLKELSSLLQQEGNNLADSLINKFNKNSDDIITLQNSLDGPNQAYQAYIRLKDEYEQQQKKINGDENTPNTLSWLKKEREYLNEKLYSDLKQQKEERSQCLASIYDKRIEIIEIYRQIKERIDTIINEHSSLLNSYEIKIDASFGIKNTFSSDFLRYVNQSKSGSFRGTTAGENLVHDVLRDSEVQTKDGILAFCNKYIELLEKEGDNDRNIIDQVDNRQGLYDFLFSIDYLTCDYSIKQGDKDLSILSPGEKGALLLVFYLLLDMDQRPLILDQPEDNLDNDSVANILVDFIQAAKKKRQIIMVTHNPNLAVVADAEQILYTNIDKKNRNTFSVVSGSIENPKMNKHIVDVLEGAMPAFKKRDHKYQEQQ